MQQSTKEHVLIVPLSLYTGVNHQKTVDAFAKLGVGRFAMIWNRGKVEELANSYRKGNMTSAEFFYALSGLFPVLKQTDRASIENAWNSMVEYTDKTHACFDQIKELESMGVTVYLFAVTNEAHAKYIQDQHRATLPGIPFFSYEKRLMGGKLRDAMLEEIKSKSPNASVAYFYEEPAPLQNPGFNLKNWLYFPIDLFRYLVANNAVKGIKQFAHVNNFTLINKNIVDSPFADYLGRELSWGLEAKGSKRPKIITPGENLTLAFDKKKGKDKEKEKEKGISFDINTAGSAPEPTEDPTKNRTRQRRKAG